MLLVAQSENSLRTKMRIPGSTISFESQIFLPKISVFFLCIPALFLLSSYNSWLARRCSLKNYPIFLSAFRKFEASLTTSDSHSLYIESSVEKRSFASPTYLLYAQVKALEHIPLFFKLSQAVSLYTSTIYWQNNSIYSGKSEKYVVANRWANIRALHFCWKSCSVGCNSSFNIRSLWCLYIYAPGYS